MPAPPAPGIVSLEAIWLQEDQSVENTFHYRVAGSITLTELSDITQTYITWLGTYHGLFHAACQLVKLQARDLSSSTGASLLVNVSPPIDGTDTGAAQPNNVTFSLKRQTGIRGRANRGRIYLIGLSTGRIAAGSQQMNAADAASFGVAYDHLRTSMSSSASATEVIYHKALGTGTDVISYAYADTYLDSQRRRLPGHNRHH